MFDNVNSYPKTSCLPCSTEHSIVPPAFPNEVEQQRCTEKRNENRGQESGGVSSTPVEIRTEGSSADALVCSTKPQLLQTRVLNTQVCIYIACI